MKGQQGMIKKQLRAGIILGLLLSGMLGLSGCGADVEAIVPVYVSMEPIGGDMTEDNLFQNDFEVKIPQGEPISTQAPAEQDPPMVTEAPVVKENVVTITISAAGDCSLGNHHQQDYGSSFNQAYDREGEAYFLQNVKEIFGADDFTIVNLEGVLTTSEARAEGRTYNIKGDPSYAGILTAGSVEAVSMANNHRLDYGAEGTKDTEAALNAENILYAYDKNVAIYETKGIRIGIVSVNEVSWGMGSEDLVAEGIEKLKEAEADLIFVACHWGVEKDNYPENYQLKLGKKCIDMGADLVIGHHPHVLQGIEEYNGKLILHSLANFSFGANRSPSDKDTMIFQQTFTFVDGVKQQDMEAKVIPCSVSSVSNRNNFQPTPLEGEEGLRVIDRLNTYSEDLGVRISDEGRIEKKE